ncbi:Ctr-domain-containing protein [Hypoxylon sp. FL0543]|nr:Ctr-domain-containing protein [Hypoxylon sp. FL0543]
MDGMSMPASTGPWTSPISTTTPSTLGLATPTSSAGPAAMEGMGDTGMANSSCRISMLWNWETIDVCFLSESWHVKSKGAFAALCIGVVLLVILLELLRRVAQVYDQHLIYQHQKTKNALAATTVNSSSDTANGALIAKESPPAPISTALFRPNVWQQAIRALLHTLHFALAYWIMLLAMYYNGYIIICIIIGAFIGFFAFQWGRIGPREPSSAIEKDSTGCHG